MTIINICILSIGASTFIKQTLKGIENQAGTDIIIDNFNTLSFKLKINKEVRVKLSHATVRPIIIYRIFYLMNIEYTFFSVVHGTFHTIDNILEYKVAYIIYTRIKKFFVFIRTVD